MPTGNPRYNPQDIVRAIQNIARHDLVDPRTGAVHGTERIVGYVAKVHTSGELAGTIDVQEYIDYDHQADINSKVGYHEGVYLSAIQQSDCYAVIPKLYSDVVIVLDMETKREYVAMVSHIDVFRVDAHEELYVGVSEREEFNPDDDNAPDVDELEMTGKSSFSRYTKDSANTSVVDEKGGKSVSQQMTAEKFELDVNGNAKLSLDDNAAEISKGGNVTLKITDNNIEVGGSDDQAVLGRELVQILSQLCSAIAKLTVNCTGPGSPSGIPLNVAEFTSISGKLSNILSKTIKLKK